jgi:hypothetical protein
MKVDVAYKTSKGYFWTKEEAEKKKNRETYGSKFPEEWESVKEVYVLVTNSNSLVFELNRVNIE